jgi:hypothetical protein
MPISLDGFRIKLINNILLSKSQEDVHHFIDVAMAELKNKKPADGIILQFVEKIAGQLDAYSPMNIEAQQWSNINMARILINRFKNQLLIPLV